MEGPVFVKEYNGKGLHALLARKEERWLLAVTTVANGEPSTKVLGISEQAVNRDAKALGMTPAKVAEHEADGIMKRKGWTP